MVDVVSLDSLLPAPFVPPSLSLLLILMSRLSFLVLFCILTPLGTGQNSNWGTLFQFDGPQESIWLGQSVAGAGDVNGDGISDIIAGAPYYNASGFTGDEGTAMIWSGADGSLLFQFDGQNSLEYFGKTVSSAGDLNGDGFGDVLVGSGSASPGGVLQAGVVRAFSGIDGTLLYEYLGAKQGDSLGSSISGTGDVNGDGFPDFIIGSPKSDPSGKGDAGIAYVWSGVDGTFLLQFKGANAGDRLGQAVSGAGDVNGDGFEDLIVGSFNAQPGGSISVFSGVDGSVLYQMNGVGGDELGKSVSGAGDLNGDGFNDFMAGAPMASPGGVSQAGSVFVWSGFDGALLYQFDGDGTGSLAFGVSVRQAGDINGDSVPDLLLGASQNFGSGGVGFAHIYSGQDGSLIHSVNNLDVADPSESFVAGLGDINGDGFGDIVIGEGDADPNSLNNAGTVYVFGQLPVQLPDLAVFNFIAGQKAIFQLDNFTPGRLALLAYSLKGAGPIGTPWGLAELSLPLNFFRPLRVDSFGQKTKLGSIDPGTTGIEVWFQAIDLGSKNLSNGVALTVQ